MYRPLLLQCILSYASLQDEVGSQDAQGDLRPKEQESSLGEDQNGSGGIALYEAEGGR